MGPACLDLNSISDLLTVRSKTWASYLGNIATLRTVFDTES